MRVLICGDRDWKDGWLIEQALLALCGIQQGTITEVMGGGTRGADTLGRQMAERLGIPIYIVPANSPLLDSTGWDLYGNQAGMLRNKRLLEEKPDLVLAFTDDLENSRWTKHMVTIAREAGIQVDIISHGG